MLEIFVSYSKLLYLSFIKFCQIFTSFLRLIINKIIYNIIKMKTTLPVKFADRKFLKIKTLRRNKNIYDIDEIDSY